MRIGTWNLDAGGSTRHREFLESLECDLLLLTEVHPDLELSGMVGHHTEHKMAPGQSWAAIYAPDLAPLRDPHPASALALVDGIRVCSSVLPWQGCASYFPWGGSTGAEKTAYAVDQVQFQARPEIWGGDWNTSFAERGYAASGASRSVLRSALAQLRLAVATEELSNQAQNDLSIDHVAVPDHWAVRSAERVRAERSDVVLSDHDAYVVEVAPGSA